MGKSISEISLDAVSKGNVSVEDVRISAQMLQNQADIAESAGKKQIAENLRRAAEMTAIEDDVVIKMYDMLDTDEVYPLEISGSQSSAMGFITQKAAEVIDYDYENSGLNEFISSILDDMDKESEDSIYDFHGIKIHLER